MNVQRFARRASALQCFWNLSGVVEVQLQPPGQDARFDFIHSIARQEQQGLECDR